MIKNPPEGMPRITPYLFYNDVSNALEWLEKSFGLKKRIVIPDHDGSIMHAEMELKDGVIMMGLSSDVQGFRSPMDLPAVNQSLYVYVDDIDAHFERAKTSGAEITSNLTNMFWGDRIYSARDLENHHWTFAEHVEEPVAVDINTV